MFSALMRGIEKVRMVLVNLLFLAIVLAVLFALSQPGNKMPEEAVLDIELAGKVVEQLERPASDAFPLALPSSDQLLLWHITRALRLAKSDAHIRMVRLKLDDMGGVSMAQLQDIRQAILDFKSSGKPVVAYAETWSQAQYYLAAAADEVILHPMGAIELTGFSAYRNYFKDALDKLNIEVHTFKVGKFKSAIEPLVRNDMSEADREANKAWLGVLWECYKSDIAEVRGIDASRMQDMIDHPDRYLKPFGGNLAALLVQEHYVDMLGDAEDSEQWMTQRLGLAEGADMATLDVRTYLALTEDEPEPDVQDAVGIIIASGEILSGEQPGGTVGGDTLAELLKRARLDERIKAVVLRINSPGGSALASEVIRREVDRLREVGKPVVVSMSGVAASGGYWIASAADEIWARPTTLTGSIGVFGAFPDAHAGLEKLGIHTDGLGTSNIAGGARIDRPLSPEIQASIQMGVENVYLQFLGHVAMGRKMDIAEVSKLAEGRVWSGQDALRLGLIDKLGGMDGAIRSAAARAGVSEYRKMLIEPAISPFELFVENLMSNLQIRWGVHVLSWLPQAWLPAMHQASALIRLNDPRNIYAYSLPAYGAGI